MTQTSLLDSTLVGQADSLLQDFDDVSLQHASAKVLENIAALGLITAAAHFERFLESCFFESMMGRHPDPEVRPLIGVASYSEVELLIYSDYRRERYLDWLPWDRTKARANAYLVNGHPFDRLANRDVEARSLESMSIVRNAIAHPGAYAEERLRKHIDEKGVRASSAGEYLLHTRAGRTEYEHFLSRVKSIARALSASSESHGAQFLDPELPFTSGKEAPAGRYECIVCGYLETIGARARMRDCPNCPRLTACSVCGRIPSGSRTSWKRLL